jgi:hypothetical protein
MKKLFTVVLCLLFTASLHSNAADFETATEAVKNMGVGWNLGNTLEANGQNKENLDPTKSNYWGQQ